MSRKLFQDLRRRAQRGVTLVYAMLALVALTLGAVALIRSVDTSVLALGNLAFKQSGLAAGSRAVQDALGWVDANMPTAVLYQNVVAQGYYATSMSTLDPTGISAQGANVQALVDWDDNGCLVNGVNVNPPACIQASPTVQVGDERVRYVITRMCAVAGPPSVEGNALQDCASPPIPNVVEGSNRGDCTNYLECEDADKAPATMFRVIARSLGPKGTVTFTETLSHY